MKVSVVNSAGCSFCWNYATDTFYGNYAGDKTSCIYAGFEVVLSVTGMMVDLCYNYAGDCFSCNYAIRNFCSTYAGDSFCCNFYCNYTDGSLNYAGGIFCSAQMTLSFIAM